MRIQFKLITNTADLVAIENEWKEIEHYSENYCVTSSFDWVYYWWTTFSMIDNQIIGFKKKLRIITFYDEGKLIGIFPLVLVTRRFLFLKIIFLEFIGQQWGGIYCDLILKKDYALPFKEVKEIINKVCSYDIIHLRYLTSSTKLFDVAELMAFSACPEIDLTQYTNKDYYIAKRYSKSLKQNLRSGQNRAQKNNQSLSGSVEKITTQDLDEIIRISKTKNLDKNKYCLYDDKNKFIFFKSLYENLTSNVIFIKIDGVNVAYRTNVFFNNTKICIDAAYDRNAPNYELGIKSVDLNITDSIEKEMKIHSFGPGMDEYKLRFANQLKILYFKILKGNTFRGLLYYPILKFMFARKYLKSANTFKTKGSEIEKT
jgi:hypothetical protein